MALGQLSYLAIIAERPEALADFYGKHFGLTELGRSAAGDVSMTDGYFNLTFLKRRAGLGEAEDRLGLHHFGLMVPDIREVEARLEEFAPDVEILPESGDLHHGEYRVHDPNGYPVSLSTRHFGVSARPRGLPSLRHIAMSVPNREEVTSFYANVFGLRETSVSQRRRQDNKPARHMGDGNTNLAILPDPDLIRELGEEREVDERLYALNTRGGVAHFGFVVASVEDVMRGMPSELAGASNERPGARRDMAEFRVFDPEWNGIDISQRKGFEVDFDVWVRAE
ncbi:MAG TPA: VOC family protein [Chloroflexota bacterium]|jgi:catechol 2,3-dioxygenase-like lactoylglutathione lyase family enzyme